MQFLLLIYDQEKRWTKLGEAEQSAAQPLSRWSSLLEGWRSAMNRPRPPFLMREKSARRNSHGASRRLISASGWRPLPLCFPPSRDRPR